MGNEDQRQHLLPSVSGGTEGHNLFGSAWEVQDPDDTRGNKPWIEKLALSSNFNLYPGHCDML